ncbi:phosphoribosylanthranilate isomerase [Myroides injenensis]|uniref:phosphoribosylanthranilate isomerase n=1 Tax=Myroides injenensis TaxID=1183151 RepID=UPI0002893524|nr:phosphoribosylanthranilate isomerase [Myroides injenensis]
MKKIKICGMREIENIKAITSLDIDYIGFIFYSKSKRFIGLNYPPEAIEEIPNNIQKVGVFVNEEKETVFKTVKKYKLDYIQLHGNESSEDCKFYKDQAIKVIKAISINSKSDFKQLPIYEDYCDIFLLDTKTPDYGGSGNSFDWTLLQYYNSSTPFLLSGGLGIENINEAIQLITDSRLIGFDLNSQLEDKPALKNKEKTKKIIKIIKS